MSLQAFQAARITVAYTGLYAGTMLNQFIHKRIFIAQAKKKDGTITTFDRYTSPLMLPHDRLAANFLEWMPAFLLPLWSMAATETLTDTCITMAWIYVGLRTLYFGLLLKYGVNKSGQNVSLWISTFPAYGCLIYLLVAAIQGVYSK